jgi:hypothetical protein
VILATFNGANVIALPCDTLPGVTAPATIEWDAQEAVAASVSPFTGQTQTYDWQNSWWEGHVSLPPMSRYASDAWSSFILECRGQSNTFSLGDPKAVLPKGPALGSPVVSGAAQTGYSLITRGWSPSIISNLLPGDYIQIGYRMYKILVAANSDSSGDATLSIWPNLRDQPADGTVIKTKNCKCLFRLKANNGNKFSTNPGSYGFTGFAIKEAI